jgi:hypothetical protein
MQTLIFDTPATIKRTQYALIDEPMEPMEPQVVRLARVRDRVLGA